LTKYLIGNTFYVKEFHQRARIQNFTDMSDRLEQLRQFYKEEPNDPFNIYGLALAYLKTDVAQSKEFFDVLLQKHPEYLPTYYHAAKLYAESADRDRAVAIYKKGIAIAEKSKDQKALRELRSAYEELIFE
jgi:tetratricopeptide (TPR) repeat protein